MDACLEYCKEKEIEPNSIARLVNKSLKASLISALLTFARVFFFSEKSFIIKSLILILGVG